MSKYRDGYLTDKGLDFARLALNNKIQIQFTKGILSAEDHTQDTQQAIQALTTLNGFCNSNPINYTSIVDSENVSVPLRFLNINMTSNNYVNTIGIFATDGTNEILYSVIINDDPELFPAYNGTTPESIKINSTTQVGRSSNVTAQLSPMGMVTEEEFQSIKDDTDHNFLGKLQHNGVDVADVNQLNSAVANDGSAAQSYANSAAGSAGNYAKSYADSVGGDTFDAALKAAKIYTDYQTLSKTNGTLTKGDSYDNYAGKFANLDINNINLLTDVASSQGLPNKQIYGQFISIPGNNQTTQIIIDNIGEVWLRTAGQAWHEVVLDRDRPLLPCDLSEVTTTGNYASTDVSSSYLSTPPDFSIPTKFMLFVMINGLDVYQQIMAPGHSPMWRMKQWSQWTSWQKMGGVIKPIQTRLLGNSGPTNQSISCVKADYNYNDSKLYLSGFCNINNASDQIIVYLSPEIFDSNDKISIGATFYDNFFGFKSFPYLDANNDLIINFNGAYLNQNISFDNMWLQINH